MIFRIICFLLCFPLAVFAREPSEILQELQENGLGENHPKVKSLKLLIHQGVAPNDPRMAEFERLALALKSSNKIPSKKHGAYLTKIYGHDVEARSLYIKPTKQLSGHEEERMLQDLFKELSGAKTRKFIIAIHPTSDGVLVVVKVEFLSELYMVIHRMKQSYIVLGDSSVSAAYARHVMKSSNTQPKPYDKPRAKMEK